MNLEITRSFKNVLTTGVLILLVLISTFLITNLGAQNGFLIAGAIIGSAVGVYSMINYKFGFYLSIVSGFLIFFIGRLRGETFPSGFLVDIQINVTFLGLLLNKVIRKESFFKNANHLITWTYLIYTLFLIIEILNPEMESVAGWVLVIRKFLQFLMIYFMGINIFKTIKDIRYFYIFWTVCAVGAGMYGCYQEWFGYFDFEMNYIWSVPGRAGLYSLDNGNFRKFSTLSGPAAYGIIMAASSLFIIIFGMGTKGLLKKIVLFSGALFTILGMAYAGTRTGYFIFVAGVGLYILMTITHRTTLIAACFFLMTFVVVIWGPIYGNPTINRIRTTFEFSDDASMAVRDVNRHAIQPYIHSHPIGGGLATSGIQGLQYNPNHYLAGFPPDSGLMKTAVETGWLGYFFQCLLYYLILHAGVRTYYRSKDKKSKLYSLIAVITVFSYVISQFGQVSIGQFPDCFLFYPLLAVFVRIDAFTKTKTE